VNRLQDTARKAALALPDVSHGRPFTPGLDVYKVADKVFLIVTDDPDEQIITVKCEPEHARALERGYASITPGRYLDKRHWISLGPGPRPPQGGRSEQRPQEHLADAQALWHLLTAHLEGLRTETIPVGADSLRATVRGAGPRTLSRNSLDARKVIDPLTPLGGRFEADAVPDRAGAVLGRRRHLQEGRRPSR
jgi:predicted DNA-binding protein (MmcQ/YjbR family)